MDNHKQIKIKNINTKLAIVFLILISIFFGSQILVTSKVGTKSTEIELIRRQKDKLRLENEILKSNIDEAMSIENLQKYTEKYELQGKVITNLDAKIESGLALENN